MYIKASESLMQHNANMMERGLRAHQHPVSAKRKVMDLKEDSELLVDCQCVGHARRHHCRVDDIVLPSLQLCARPVIT